jgi:hypothetical protein
MAERDTAIDLAVDATFDLSRFVHVAREGLGAAAQATRVAKVLAGSRNRTRKAGTPPHPTAEELESASKLEAFAAKQFPHFPFLYGLAAFRLYAILEAGVEDWLRDLLVIHPEIRERPAFAQLEGALVPFARATPLQQAQMLLDGVKGRLATPLKKGVGRFETLLDACGLGGAICDVVRRLILELIEVRNSVAHRNGKADERFLQQCPWFLAARGQPLLVTPLHFDRYVVAVHWYLVELSRRYDAIHPSSAGAASKKPAEIQELLDELKARLQQMELSLKGKDPHNQHLQPTPR